MIKGELNMMKTDNVKVAVWVSAAILTFNEYNEKDGDIYFRQTDIQRMAEKLCSKDVASARIGQWYNGDHANNTYNFLRSKGSLRRLTKFGEFNGVKEYPEELLEYLNELVTVRNFEEVSVKDLFSWVREVYSANVKEIQAEEPENKIELFNFDNLSNNEYDSRIDLIISQSWEILKSQFMGGRLSLSKEAPFQHHFATIIKTVGDLHCYKRSEQFIVDLETREVNKHGSPTYVDITLEMFNESDLVLRAAIELKFKKKSQGADDFARIDSYIDIESLEYLKNNRYNKAYFFMITDNEIYTKESRTDTTGDIFSMRDGYTVPMNRILTNPNCKGRSKVEIVLSNEYTFKWSEKNNWYFLRLDV